ncbi:hypothetical protein C4F49_08405 [Sphingobacterium sp. KB22]|uniref:Uncharacterized protein n=1 Tax=Sphingobacterium hungaricum TaxID=2082723 RepID=A0A928YQ86_9SPHI|nr:hypothetical protein [Sphingobacterium hungaricum]
MRAVGTQRNRKDLYGFKINCCVPTARYYYYVFFSYKHFAPTEQVQMQYIFRSMCRRHNRFVANIQAKYFVP